MSDHEKIYKEYYGELELHKLLSRTREPFIKGPSKRTGTDNLCWQCFGSPVPTLYAGATIEKKAIIVGFLAGKEDAKLRYNKIKLNSRRKVDQELFRIFGNIPCWAYRLIQKIAIR